MPCFSSETPEKRISVSAVLLVSALFAAIVGCGSGGGGAAGQKEDAGGMEISGKLSVNSFGSQGSTGGNGFFNSTETEGSDEAGDSEAEEGDEVSRSQSSFGSPVSDARITVAGGSGTGLTDNGGSFSIFTTERGPAVGLTVEAPSFSSSYVIENIPAGTVQLALNLVYDEGAQTVSAESIEFRDINGSPISSGVTGTPAPAPTSTPPPASSNPTSKPTSRPTAQPTSRPTTQPTQAPAQTGNFDANGNTTKFGIPGGLVGNISSGGSVWSSKCTGCHGSEKTNRSYSQLKSAMGIPEMRGLNLSNQQLANLTAYLNRSQK